jgi:hypothetical protein
VRTQKNGLLSYTSAFLHFSSSFIAVHAVCTNWHHQARIIYIIVTRITGHHAYVRIPMSGVSIWFPYSGVPVYVPSSPSFHFPSPALRKARQSIARMWPTHLDKGHSCFDVFSVRLPVRPSAMVLDKCLCRMHACMWVCVSACRHVVQGSKRVLKKCL